MRNGHAPSLESSPRGIVELVGPAGSGKSTLLRTLSGHDRALRVDLALWGQPRARLFASAFALLPVMWRALCEGHPLRAGEFAQMIRMETLHWRVREALSSDRAVLVLDEGPVFGLTWLRVAHGARGGSARRSWERRVIAAWARAILIVVRLDADDAALSDRIRTRKKDHPLKGSSDADIAEFSAHFRREFDHVLSELHASGPLLVLTHRTDEATTEDAAHSLQLALEGMHRGH